MRHVAATVSKPGNFSIPRGFDPGLIIDVGARTKFSTLEYAMKYPEAKIISFSRDKSNFLRDFTEVTYHDNVTFRYLPEDADLDYLIYKEISKETQIGFIKFDLFGLEKKYIKNGGRWAVNTKYLKARLTDYNYQEAKSDLRRLGFYSAAMHDGYSFYVIGERID
jgi:hypothetical protein